MSHDNKTVMRACWDVWLLFLFGRSVMSDSVTPWTAARQASLSFTIARTSHQVANVLVHFASASDLSKMLIIPEGAEGRDV